MQPQTTSTDGKPAEEPADTAQNGGMALTQDDVRRLLQDSTANARIDMTRKLASSYGGETLNETETMVAEQIFRLLLRDTEVRVRSSLAENIMHSTNIPKDILKSLASDVEEVALPVLQFSEVLNDEDLLDLVHNTQEISRYLAVSKREQVSDVLTDTLLEKGDVQVAAALVENTGAKISETGITKIIETYHGDEKVMEAMSSRPHLPVSAVEKMVRVVSSSLAEGLRRKYSMPIEQTEQMAKEVDKTREGETLGLVKLARTQADIDKLIGQLQAFERLNPSIILSGLCQGNFLFFETALARLSGIAVSNARTLIADKGDLGFRAIYNKSGLPDAMFPAVKLLLAVVRELDAEGEKSGSSRFANRIVERVLRYSESQNIDNLSYIIALVRRVAQ